MKHVFLINLDIEFMETFLLTYQSFTTAKDLLQKLIEKYNISWTFSRTWSEFENTRNISQIRVCNIILTWTKKYTSDFITRKKNDKANKAAEIAPSFNTLPRKVGKKGFAGEMLRFVENVLSQDHPLMARQIRRNIIRLQEDKGNSITSRALVYLYLT